MGNKIFTSLFCIVGFFLTGCATVILDNEKTLSPGSPDPLVFENPICIHLNLQADDVDIFNRRDIAKPMLELDYLKATSGLSYYNISINCTQPTATYTLIVKSNVRNWWVKAPWAFSSLITMGVIPFYLEDIGAIQVIENNSLLVELPYSEKRLTSIFAVPKYIADSKITISQYHTDTQRATLQRRIAMAIRMALEKK